MNQLSIQGINEFGKTHEGVFTVATGIIAILVLVSVARRHF